jgi:hypothetical protein
MYIIADLKMDDGKSVGVITAPQKDFKTGSKGFFGNGKIDIDGKRYTVQIQLVEIGSRPKTEAEK